MRTRMYFTDGKVIADSNDIVIYEMDGIRYLEQGPGHNLWTDSDEIEQLSEQIARRPFGDCLEIGLGLGVASKYILSRANVNSLTTIEINEDVVYLYYELNKKEDRHTIICQNGLDYIIETALITDERFDFVFLDMYSCIDEDTLPEIEMYVKSSRKVLKTGGEVMGWFDTSTPPEFAKEFFNLFGSLYIGD
jgi:spermidine synthase